jgi:hypothetical protein
MVASFKGSAGIALGTPPCGECCDDCMAGLVFPSGDDSLVYYDFALNRAMLFSLANPTDANTWPGISEAPWTGLSLPGGPLVLLVDRAASGRRRPPYRLALYSLQRRDTAWRLEKTFNLPWLNFTSPEGVALDASLRLTLSSRGILQVSNFEHDTEVLAAPVTSPALGIGDWPPAPMRIVPVKNGPTVADSTATSLAIFGRDRAGNAYAENVDDVNNVVVDRIGPDGRISMCMILPVDTSRYALRQPDIFVRADGSIVHVIRKANALIVKRFYF